MICVLFPVAACFCAGALGVAYQYAIATFPGEPFSKFQLDWKQEKGPGDHRLDDGTVIWIAPNSAHKPESYFPTGVGGILYPPKCFHKDIADKELFLKLAPNADDIWFWAMACLIGRKKINHCCPLKAKNHDIFFMLHMKMSRFNRKLILLLSASSFLCIKMVFNLYPNEKNHMYHRLPADVRAVAGARVIRKHPVRLLQRSGNGRLSGLVCCRRRRVASWLVSLRFSR
jgi:hypothetical protein